MGARSEVLQAVQSTIPPRNWEKSPTPDEIIDAFEAGKSVQERINFQVLSENLKKACATAESLYSELSNKIKLPCTNLHMRINGLSQFEALFLVDLSGYISEKRNDAYKAAKELSRESGTDTFHIEFTFMPVSGEVNAESISADGYMLTYHPNAKQTRTRKA